MLNISGLFIAYKTHNHFIHKTWMVACCCWNCW